MKFQNIWHLFTAIFTATTVHAQDMTYDGQDILGIESIVDVERSKNEPWRKEANQRIEQHRKADIHIQVIDQQGQPVEDATVQIQLKKHHFKFGGVVSARILAGQVKNIDPEMYKSFCLQSFNQVGFNNALKYKLKKGLAPLVPPIMSWLKQNDMPVRGHTLIWPGWNHMHKDAVQLKEDPEALRQFCDQQIIEYAQNWDVVEWDVMNEPRGNHDIQDILGKDVIVEWFQLAKQHVRNKDALLFLNENRVVSAPPAQKKRYMKLYLETARYLQEKGAPISGVGYQSRYKWDCPPEEMYARLCEMDKALQLPISATEFEVADTPRHQWTEETRSEMTERVMTVYFSHPSVISILAWTIIDRDENQKGLARPDGTLKKNGKVWHYLTKQKWHTDEAEMTDATGAVSFRGFKGDYSYTIQHGNNRTEGTFKLENSKQMTLKLQ